jgi:hypothetical protein
MPSRIESDASRFVKKKKIVNRRKPFFRSRFTIDDLLIY